MSWAWSRAPPAPPLPAALPEVSSVTAAGPLMPEAHTPALPSLLDEPISFEQVIALAAKSRLTPLPVPRRSSELLSPSVPVVGPSLGARPPAAEGPATGPSGAKQREAHPSLGLEDVDVAWALDVNEAVQAPAERSSSTSTHAPNGRHPSAEASSSLAAASSATPPPSKAPAPTKPLMKSIKVVRSGPAATSKSPSTSNQRPAKADALPVRDEVYNLPSDDDADMIECEPDPDDVKPTLSLGPAASVAASASSARNKSKPATPLKTKPAAVKRPTKASAVAKKVGKKAGKQLDGPQPPTVAKARIVKGRKPQPSVVLHFPSPTTSLSKTPAFEPIGPASNKVGDKPIPDAPASPTASEPLFARATPAPAPVVLPIAVSSSPVSIAQGPASGLLNPPAAAALPVLVSGHASVNPSGQDEAASVHSAIGQPTDDGIVRQLFKGKELTFKRDTDGFFTCTICDDYSKSHPVPFKAHVVRCAAEHEGDSSPSSRNASSANERFASRPSGAAAAVVQSRRSLDDGDHQLEGSDEDGDRPPRKSKPISEKAIKRSTGALAKSRKADPPIKRRPRVNIDLKSASTRAIKTTARPSTAKGKERQLLSDSDDGDGGPVPPKASRRKALFVPSEAEPDPSGGLQRQVLEDNDDGIVFVLVRGELTAVKPVDGRYTCPACQNYFCRNPLYLKDHVSKSCERAVVRPGIGLIASGPDMLSSLIINGGSTAIPVPPQQKTHGGRTANGSAAALPSFGKGVSSAGASSIAASDSQPTAAGIQLHALASHLRWTVPSSTSSVLPRPTLLKSSLALSGTNHLPQHRRSIPGGEHLSSVIPSRDHGHDYGQGSPSPPRSPPLAVGRDPAQSSRVAQPGLLLHALHLLLTDVVPPSAAMFGRITSCLELLRLWQIKLSTEGRSASHSGTVSAHERMVCWEVFDSLRVASIIEIRYGTSPDNAMRLWHLQHHLITALDRPSVYNDLTELYFRPNHRRAVPPGSEEQRRLDEIASAAKQLLLKVQSTWRVYDGPIGQTAQWLESAQISVARPFPLALNHVCWAQICGETLDWAERVVSAYDRLAELEAESRDAAEALGRSQLEALLRNATQSVHPY